MKISVLHKQRSSNVEIGNFSRVVEGSFLVGIMHFSPSYCFIFNTMNQNTH